MIPGLEERLIEDSDEGVVHIAELVSRYINFDFSKSSLSPDPERCLECKIG
jgi:hypothetical protein